jgi:hypothetical protein
MRDEKSKWRGQYSELYERYKSTVTSLVKCETRFWTSYGKERSWDSSVSVVSDYMLDEWGSVPGRGKRLFLYPLCPDRLWGPPNLLHNGYRVLSPGVKRGRSVTLTTHPHLVPRSIMSRSYIHLPLVACIAVSDSFYMEKVFFYISMYDPSICQELLRKTTTYLRIVGTWAGFWSVACRM